MNIEYSKLFIIYRHMQK